jgi:hypothetical protein
MDPDKPENPRSLIRIHVVRLETLLQVGCAVWSGSMLDALRWFCRDAAYMSFSMKNNYEIRFLSYIIDEFEKEKYFYENIINIITILSTEISSWKI